MAWFIPKRWQLYPESLDSHYSSSIISNTPAHTAHWNNGLYYLTSDTNLEALYPVFFSNAVSSSLHLGMEGPRTPSDVCGSRTEPLNKLSIDF